MNDKKIASRRDALALASLAAAFVMGGGTAEARPIRAGKSARPSAEELARATHLFGGELGGFKGAR